MDITIVSLDQYLSDPTSDQAREEARKAAESLILTGALIVKDSRAPKEANDRFLDLFEDYFNQDKQALKRDERPEVGYQVVSYQPLTFVITSPKARGADFKGVTLENTEKPKCGSDEGCLAIIKELEESERPLDITGHGADPKCRYVIDQGGNTQADRSSFFHKMSQVPPYKSAFPISEVGNIVPRAFEDIWEERVDEWGCYMKQAFVDFQRPPRRRLMYSVEGVSRMAAVGLGLEENAFIEAGQYG